MLEFQAGLVDEFGQSLGENDIEFLMSKIKPTWPNLMFDALFHLDKAATALSNQVCMHPFFIRKAPVTPWGQTINDEQPRPEASSSSASSSSRPPVASSSSSSSSSSQVRRASANWDSRQPTRVARSTQKNTRNVVSKGKSKLSGRARSEERASDEERPPKKRSRSPSRSPRRDAKRNSKEGSK